jgi:hypothetical protein
MKREALRLLWLTVEDWLLNYKVGNDEVTL